MTEARANAVDVATYLAAPDPEAHAFLGRIREWLLAHAALADPTALALVLAIGEALRGGHIPRGRLLSVRVGGHTKAVRVEDHRETLEAALGEPLEEVVRLHGVSALAFGPFRFHIEDRVIDGTWSVPWLALTQETLARMTDLELDSGVTRLLTIENLVPFEEEVRRGLPSDTVAVFVGGFPAGVVRQLLHTLCAAGIEHVDHWGDLDLGGLRILRYLAELLPVPVRPFRMEPALLQRLPTLPLTDRDRDGLTAWVSDLHAPARELAQALLDQGSKAEQEGWLLL